MLWKCCTQYVSKYGKLSSVHRTGKHQFSLQSQRKAMPKNAQAITNYYTAAATAAKSLQLCLTLCNPIDSSPPGSSIPGILQARVLEWVAIAFSDAWKWKVKVTLLSRDWLLVIPWTAAHQAPPSLGFSRQEYWSGVPLVGWHHWLNGLECEQAPGVGDGQGSLVHCSPWCHKESDTTERLNWTEATEERQNNLSSVLPRANVPNKP